MWFRSFCYLFLFVCICTTDAIPDDSYSKHCSTVIPRYDSTARSSGNNLPFLSTPYFSGGGSLLRMEPGRTYYYVRKNLRLSLRSNYYQTTAAGVYEVGGFLHIRTPYTSDDAHSNYSYGGRRHRANGSIKFPMDGFWSEKSRKLCMVGSASWRGMHRDAVLKLKFEDAENLTIYTSVVSGSLESTASPDSQPYFTPILIFSFEEVSNYKYSLAAKDIGGAFPSRKSESLSLDAAEFCLMMRRVVMELEYAADCTGSHHCSPLGDGFMPAFLSLTSVQCLEGSKKARFIAKFLNSSYDGYDGFTLGSTVMGEAWWDEESNRVIGVACEILDPSHKLGDAVGICTTRFIIRYPSVRTLRNDAKIDGKMWSSKAYFRQINLTSSSDVMELAEQRYEYTEVDTARKYCTKKKPAKKKGDVYPDGQSYDMRLDMSIKNGKGQELAGASATPIWVGNESYHHAGGGWGDMLVALGPTGTMSYAEQRDTTSSPTKISYRIRINPYFHVNSTNTNISSPTLDWPISPYSSGVEITAEGLYDSANGHLCMVGCRSLLHNSTSNTSKVDCQLVVEFDLPPMNRARGSLTMGVLRSTRPKTDPLHFDDLILQSYAYYRGEAARSIWRMDLEIAMVLISNTLACIFVALQIFHVKRSPEVPSAVSLVMLVVLSVGHMIPLVLNFEAVFLGNRNKSTLELGSGGRLEANEVAVRVITMVVLLLQLRLFQLVWGAKQSDKSWWSGEKKAGFASLSLYVIGGLLTLLLNWLRKTNVLGWRYSVWGDLRSYAGLVLDGFLVPQILLNVWRGSAEKALSHSFYVGTSVVRLVPHAYNQYRAHNYPKVDLNATYYYANPAADMYSTAWDIIIPSGIMALAVIVLVQQRHGGRCILPKRLMKGFEMYEKMPTTDNQ